MKTVGRKTRGFKSYHPRQIEKEDRQMTLRECLDLFEPCGVKDEDIIFQYLRMNNKEEVAIKMMADLSAAKLAEYKGNCDHAESALTCFPISYLIKQYGQKNGQTLFDFTVFVIFNEREHRGLTTELFLDREIPQPMLKKLSELVPTLDKPKYVFYRNALEILHKNGIYFKGEK